MLAQSSLLVLEDGIKLYDEAGKREELVSV